MSYKIIEWGPGFRQVYTNDGRCAPIMTGEIAVTISDPTRVLFWQGAQRSVIRVMPEYGGKQQFILTGGSHGLGGLYDKQGDRLTKYLVEQFEDEIRKHFDALPLVDDCRPSLDEIDAFVYEDLTLWTFDPYEKITPETHPFGPTIRPKVP